METIKSMWDFFQNEILGMNWLNKIIKNLLESLGLDTSSGSETVCCSFYMTP